MTIGTSEWGNKAWVLIYCASNSVDTVYGAEVESTLYYDATLTTTDLTGSATLIIGNNNLGNSPTHLVRHF